MSAREEEPISLHLIIEQFIAAEDWSSVVTICTEALSNEAHNAALYVDRGTALVHLERHTDALEDFELALNIEPLNSAAAVGRAQVLLHAGQVEEAENLVLDLLENDIENRNGNVKVVLKQVAIVKFRDAIRKGFANGRRTRFSYLEFSNRAMTEKLTTEEAHSAKLELMKIWCDRFENCSGSNLLFIRNKDLCNMIASLCYKLKEYIMAIFCLHLTYVTILEDPLSAKVEQMLVLRNMSKMYILTGNVNAANKILTIAVNIEDPTADPEVRLMNHLMICDLQLDAGALGEPIQMITNIRREAEERGIRRIVVFSDMLLLRSQSATHQPDASAATFKRFREGVSQLGDFVSDAQRAETERFANSGVFSMAQELSPTSTENVLERTKQVAKAMADNPLYVNPESDTHGQYVSSALKALQSIMELANSGVTASGNIANLNACNNAQGALENLVNNARRSNDYSQMFLWEPCSALMNLLCGKTEQANEQFIRCLNLAKSMKHERTANICLHYVFALMYQRNFNEALVISVEAEKYYNELYTKASSDNQQITINQEKCLIGSLQLLIFAALKDFIRAIYASERYRMPALRYQDQFPLIDANSKIQEFISSMVNYCKITSSILLYLCDSQINLVFCWIITADNFSFFSLRIEEQLESTLEVGLEGRNDFSKIMMPILLAGHSFRTFNNNNNIDYNSEPSQKYLSLVGKLLWKRIVDDGLLTEARRIVIIPDRRLHQISYSTLGNSSSSNSVKDYPLLDKFIISISHSFLALSPTLLKSTKQVSKQSDQKTNQSIALIIGNPENNLPAAEKEASLVAHIIERRKELTVLTLTQQLASKDIILDSLPRSSVVHIASHGSLKADDQHIRAGAIELYDGTLYSKEIEELDLHNVDLVFINCCLSGLGIMYEEGPVGLTRSFLLAGAKNVVAYRGEVPDEEITCALVQAFYEEWICCKEADTSLRAAQIKMLENEFHHNFWAGYSIIRQNSRI